ncbi:MAG: hypothetical protein RL042_845 [Nitrospirota bacterium]|jgi:hypothetical protein
MKTKKDCSIRGLLGGGKLAATLLLAVMSMGASPMDALVAPHADAAHTVHDAEHAVDYAWETYHRSALGGTIASPDIQLDVENHLHESRSLLINAREAAERGDRESVDRYVQAINQHLQEAIKGSMEKKK